MKIIKILGGLIALIVAVIIAALIYLSLNLNTVVKRGVEEAGPKLTQTGVTLDKVDISLREGRASLFGFAVANPPSFKSKNVFEFSEFTLQIDPASVSEDVIVIKNIVVSGISVTAEQQGTTTNLQEIKRAVDAYLPTSKSDTNAGESTSSDLRFMLEHIRFDKGNLTVITEKYGEKNLSLPELEQSNIGNKTSGITAEELGKRILQSISDNAKKAAEKELKKAMTDEAKAKAKTKAKSKLKELLNN